MCSEVSSNSEQNRITVLMYLLLSEFLLVTAEMAL